MLDYAYQRALWDLGTNQKWVVVGLFNAYAGYPAVSKCYFQEWIKARSAQDISAQLLLFVIAYTAAELVERSHHRLACTMYLAGLVSTLAGLVGDVFTVIYPTDTSELGSSYGDQNTGMYMYLYLDLGIVWSFHNLWDICSYDKSTCYKQTVPDARLQASSNKS